ncbi:MAG: MarR family transcriptional regulator [Pseudomonas putida]|jgi:DNA-binding MarR family transcriptional regulator|nr:MarR family transcriptional regulator [Pseudomonas putida]
MEDIPAISLKSVCAGILLGQSAAAKDRILDRHLMPLGITAAQFKVLRIIAGGDRTAAQVCRFLFIQSGAMSRMLDRLERKELIVRIRQDHDQRQARLALTEKGRAVSERLPVLVSAAMNEFAAMLSETELVELEFILKKMLSQHMREVV